MNSKKIDRVRAITLLEDELKDNPFDL